MKYTKFLKELEEKRAKILNEMDSILDTAKTEVRALSDGEQEEFKKKEREVSGIDETIETTKRQAKQQVEKVPEDTEDETKEQKEERAFANYVRGVIETRADVNLTKGDNGGVIPSSIANKIIEKVKEISPVYQLAEKYNIGGNLSIPLYDEETQTITMAYATEFEELESTAGKFKTIELGGYLAGALTKISKSLINNSQFSIVEFTINKMAEAVAVWVENELLNGTDGKIEGLSKLKQSVTAAAATAITTDEIIDLQEKIPDKYQGPAIWVMNKATRTIIRKMKDNDGNYILNKDATSRWGYVLFGKDVFVSDAMAKMESGKTAIYYGDFSGLAVKISEESQVEVLREKFATQHVVGVITWMEIDAKVENEQKLAKLVMA